MPLPKDTHLLNEHEAKISPDDDSDKFRGSYICSSCGVVFETEETLDLHEMRYCTKRNGKIRMKKQALQLGDISKEIIMTLFQKSLTNSHLSSHTANTTQEVTSVKVTDDSSNISGTIIKLSKIVKSSAETYIRPGIIAIKESELPVPTLLKSVEGKQKMLPSVKQLEKEKLVRLEKCVANKAVKVKQHILKRKNG